MQVELNSGVLNSASSRKLDRTGWRVDSGAPQADGSLEVAAWAGDPTPRAERVAKLLIAPAAPLAIPPAVSTSAGSGVERWTSWKSSEVTVL